ncbi:AfsR/SARP family transcriptional regulator [Nonomuraea sp. NPDC004580]|uniref:AfsR/SARP family transcriptional regulator n=1 Tax=Nonomuraea sp. NPDC004580 TaxID=3154552 RepID=UPI0033BBC7C3
MTAWQGEREIALQGSKQRTMFAALLFQRGQVVSDLRLGELLWGDRPPATASAQIHTYASRLRKQLAPAVTIRRHHPGYLLQVCHGHLDLELFESRVRFGHSALRLGGYEESVNWFRSALRLWHGPALSNVTEHLIQIERPRLEEARLTALSSLIDAELALGRHTRLIPELVDLVIQHPLQERFRAQLMMALDQEGCREEALSVYQEGRRLLAEELGVDPSPTLRSVYQALLSGESPKVAVPTGAEAS